MLGKMRGFDLLAVDADPAVVDVCRQVSRVLRLRLAIGDSRFRLNFFLQSHPDFVAAVVVDWDHATPDTFAQIRQFFPNASLLLASQRTSETDQHVAGYLGATQLLKKPLNVSELANAVRFAIRSRAAGNEELPCEQKELPKPVLCWHCQTQFLGPETLGRLDETERRLVFRAMEFTKGDACKAAGLLGIGKTTMYRRLAQYRQKESGSSIGSESSPTRRKWAPATPRFKKRTHCVKVEQNFFRT